MTEEPSATCCGRRFASTVDAEVTRLAWLARGTDPPVDFVVRRCDAASSSSPPHFHLVEAEFHGSGCARKKKFLTREDAAGAVRAMERSGQAYAPLRVYQCRTCLRFHISSTPARSTR